MYINNRLHLAVQHKIIQLIGDNSCKLEHRIKNHIADIYWVSQNIVFEIQCSPITLKEAVSRTKDFEDLGVGIIWILHQKTYNKTHMNPAEKYLISCKNVYYSNIDQGGDGIIFDQEQAILFNKRLHKSCPKQVNLAIVYKSFFSKKLKVEGAVQRTNILKRIAHHPEIFRKKMSFTLQKMRQRAIYAFTGLKWHISLG